MNLRQTNLERLAKESFDVLIIGAGINGAIAAAALSTQGAHVALIDRGDFASLTSQESSNLVWGGIKYLESFELGLVRKLCRCRNELIASYPASVRESPVFGDTGARVSLAPEHAVCGGMVLLVDRQRIHAHAAAAFTLGHLPRGACRQYRQQSGGIRVLGRLPDRQRRALHLPVCARRAGLRGRRGELRRRLPLDARPGRLLGHPGDRLADGPPVPDPIARADQCLRAIRRRLQHGLGAADPALPRLVQGHSHHRQTA